MKLSSAHAVVALLAVTVLSSSADASEPPASWIDPETGHKVICLTPEPGSASLYFNESWYAPDGSRMIYSTPAGISTVDLRTLERRAVVTGQVRAIGAGHKNPTVYYRKRGENALYRADLDSGESRKVADLPPRGGISSINADETIAAGTYIEGKRARVGAAPGEPPSRNLEQPRSKGQMMVERLAAKLPMALFTVNLETGEIRTLLHTTDWLGHLLFSPTDPTLLMYCHEGPWHKVDRIWTIRTDGTDNKLRHQRTMAMEIAGHEFWSKDGQSIWYDLQLPKGDAFYLAGLDLRSGDRTWYHPQRDEWSIHFNVSRDGTLFCGDGGDPGQVAKAPDGQWIYLFRPELKRFDPEDGKGLIRPGVLHAERLVNMSRHNYKLEPNVCFSPRPEAGDLPLEHVWRDACLQDEIEKTQAVDQQRQIAKINEAVSHPQLLRRKT